MLPPADRALAQSTYVTAIVRLLLDRRGRVHHGELVDAASGALVRFAGRRGLSLALRNWLDQQATAVSADQDPGATLLGDQAE